MSAPAHATSFLTTLFAGKPESSYLLLWTLDDKRSHWFLSPVKATQWVEKNAHRDVYVGVSLSPKQYGPDQRCPAEETAGIVGLWVDLDIKGPGHKKQDLPESIEEALSLIADLKPTAVIHSGGGLQAWWLFKEPWVFDIFGERQQAADLALRWANLIRGRGLKRGWDVDRLADLARVFRVPGTTNTKLAGQPRPVTIHSFDERRRYNPSDLSEQLDALGEPQLTAAPAAAARVGELVYDAQAKLDFEKFELLCEAEPKFRLTWDHARKDLPDQSASSYDMALANYAVQAAWTDQEIVNLLIHHRRKYKEDLKLRDSYYKTTIGKARAETGREQAHERIEHFVASEETHKEGAPPPPAETKRQLVDDLSEVFGVPITRIVKYRTDPPQYRLETKLGTIALGQVNNLIENRPFQRHVAAATGILVPVFKAGRWNKIAQALLRACVEEDVGDEATDRGITGAWIEGYLQVNPVLDDIATADASRSPFRENGHVCLFLDSLRRWVNLQQGERLTSKELSVLLRGYGAKSDVQNLDVEGKKTSRSVWRLPAKK